MRTKDEILNDLLAHTERLDPEHRDLAEVAIIETEVLIDIRDCIQHLFDLRHAWDEEPKPPN